MKRRPVPLSDLLARMEEVVYPALLEEFTVDCCIAAAAILTRVFGEYGYRAKVLPVSVEIYNAAMLRVLRNGVAIPPHSDRARREMFLELTGAWGVGILPASAALMDLHLRDRRARCDRVGYGGHLVLQVNECLVDATLKQADRPEKGIVLPNLIVSNDVVSLVKHGTLSLQVGECAVRYQRINDESYRTAPDWTRRSTPFPETVRRILSRVEARNGTEV